jgi:energy-coupling factor transport system permease protein
MEVLDMVLMEYEAKDTIIHRLNSLTKIIWLGTIVFIFTLVTEPQPLPIVALLVVLVGYLSKISWRKLLARAWWAYLGSIVGGFTVSLWITTPAQLLRVPPDFGTTVLLELTSKGTPILGRLAVTYGGILWATASTLKVALAISAACIFTYSTPLSEIVSIINKVMPYKVSFIIMAGVRFYPVLMEKVQTITDAARSRGWGSPSANPVDRVKSISPILFPSIREAMGLADKMSLAIEARAFGVGKPTALKAAGLKSSDLLFVAFSVSIALTLSLMWWFYGFGML